MAVTKAHGGEDLAFLTRLDLSTLGMSKAQMPALLCSFQSPVEVPGVSNSDFLRLAANARRKQLGQEELGPLEFYGYVMPKVRALAKPWQCHSVAVVSMYSTVL